MFTSSSRFDPVFFFSPDPDGSGGGGNPTGNSAGNGSENGGNENPPAGQSGGAGNGNPTTNDNQEPSDSVELAVSAARVDLVAKHGSLEKAANFLIKRTHGLEKQLADAKGASISKVDRERLDAFKALGKTPEELTQALQRAGRADELERKEVVKESCSLAGIDYHDLLTRKGVDDWKFEIKPEERNGQTVKVPYVTFQDGDKEQTKPLLDHATTAFPTLARTGEQSEGNGHQNGFTRYGKIAPAGGGAAPTLAEQIRAEAEARRKRSGPGLSAGAGAGGHAGAESEKRPSLGERLGRTR